MESQAKRVSAGRVVGMGKFAVGSLLPWYPANEEIRMSLKCESRAVSHLPAGRCVGEGLGRLGDLQQLGALPAPQQAGS